MEKTYVITWKSKLGAFTKQGTKHFTREEAEALAIELNEEHPDIFHEILNLAAPVEIAPAAPAAVEDTIIRGVDFAGKAADDVADEQAQVALG